MVKKYLLQPTRD